MSGTAVHVSAICYAVSGTERERSTIARTITCSYVRAMRRAVLRKGTPRNQIQEHANAVQLGMGGAGARGGVDLPRRHDAGPTPTASAQRVQRHENTISIQSDSASMMTFAESQMSRVAYYRGA
eukprot:2655212-Rhodomonas_salina.2